MKNGIDISNHQGTVDWGKVTAEFVMIRAGWSWYEGGMNIDKRFLANVAGAQQTGIPWGVYLYAYDLTPAAAKIAANQLADLLDKYQIPYPVAYDFEDIQYITKSKAANTAICKAFLETLQKRGYYAMLYTYTSLAKSNLNMAELSAYDFWVAHYSKTLGWTGEYGMWQYSGSGTAPGISVAVDLDYAYKDYPSIIQAAGLNGYSNHLEKEENPEKEESDFTALQNEIAALQSENTDLKAKIAAAQRALE